MNLVLCYDCLFRAVTKSEIRHFKGISIGTDRGYVLSRV
jgi:hypothetical protein